MARKSYEGEVRSSRVTLLATPKFMEQINLLASSQGLTVSDFIVRNMQKVIDRNASVIEEFVKAREIAKKNFVDAD